MKPTKESTIKEGQQWLKENAKEGTKCPCCGLYVRIYTRKITSSMAYALILMSKPEGWIHMENYISSLNVPPAVAGDFPKLRFWGLVEAKIEKTEDGNPNNGYYRVTDLGKKFVANNLQVAKHIRIFNNVVLSVDDSVLVTITDCLTKRFNYNELMNG